MDLYKDAILKILFRFSEKDPEIAHEILLRVLRMVGENRALYKIAEKLFSVKDPRLHREVLGIKFPNPVGLAAGFDKNAVAILGFQALGVGFIEIGTVTPYPQNGYSRPRIFRIPRQEAIINRMGFPNEGVDALSKRLEKLKNSKKLLVPIGINIGKSFITSLDDAPMDYIYSLKKLYALGDYFVINISSPNTPNLRELQGRRYIEEFLYAVKKGISDISESYGNARKPLLLKISPDLRIEELDVILEASFKYDIDGIVAVNTTTDIGEIGYKISPQGGGLSGRPLFRKAIEVIRYIFRKTEGALPIIGVGGILSPADAYIMLKSGAKLVQVYTGFIYNGPFFIRDILKNLIKFIEVEKIYSISEL
jgi:dihydroorotate dehydrogenase